MFRAKVIKVGVTGGIGSGKSVVCRIFGLLGVPVYNSDVRAKELMRHDAGLAGEIKRVFGAGSYRDGELDTSFIADKVFSDKALLIRLDSLVHPAVMRDFEQWAAVVGRRNAASFVEEIPAYSVVDDGCLAVAGRRNAGSTSETQNAASAGDNAPGYVIMESAIIFEAGLAGMFDRMVTVSAPQELRLERAMMRSNISREQVLERIANQIDDSRRESQADFVICNDETALVWEQVLEIDCAIRQF